jgi:probable addiction module antidote protein
MAKTKTRRYDVGAYLKTERDAVGYFEAALEDGDPAVVAAALGHIARARGMSKIARKTGFQRENLYRALSAQGNPELATFLKVVEALGLRLHASALSQN